MILNALLHLLRCYLLAFRQIVHVEHDYFQYHCINLIYCIMSSIIQYLLILVSLHILLHSQLAFQLNSFHVSRTTTKITMCKDNQCNLQTIKRSNIMVSTILASLLSFQDITLAANNVPLKVLPLETAIQNLEKSNGREEVIKQYIFLSLIIFMLYIKGNSSICRFI